MRLSVDALKEKAENAGFSRTRIDKAVASKQSEDEKKAALVKLLNEFDEDTAIAQARAKHARHVVRHAARSVI